MNYNTNVSAAWHIHIGDPTVIGWVIFLGYLAATVLCIAAAATSRRSARHDGSAPLLFWGGLATIILMLGINKQLDLQELLIIVGRNAARSAGLLEARREMQRWFVMFLAATGGLGLAGTGWFFRRELSVNPLIAAGVATLTGFVFTRAASINHVELFPSRFEALGPIPLKYAFECMGVLLVALGAWRRIIRARNDHSGGRTHTT